MGGWRRMQQPAGQRERESQQEERRGEIEWDWEQSGE
jgi:hypothetical protein